MTLKEALASEQKLREAVAEDERVARLFEIAGTLEGLYSNASTHAAGIVIADQPLDEVTPLYLDAKAEMQVTQFNMKWIECSGSRQIRLPRAEDSHGACGGVRSGAPAPA